MKKKTKEYSVNIQQPILASEPAITYGLNFEQNNYFQNIKLILGIQKSVNSEYDLISLSRNGLRKSSVVSLSKYLGITMEKMSELLNISSRTLQRKADDEALNITTSFQTLEVAELTAKGIDVLGTKENFSKWLSIPLVAIGNIPPINLLDTTQGIKILSKILGRIEHGIYS